MNDTARRVALVTGGSRGIGRQVVARLAADGYDVAFCYASQSDAATATEKLARDAGAQVLTDRVDVTSLSDVRAFVTQVEETLGDIDLVVASAGIVRDNPLVLMDEAAWHDVVNTNLTGTFTVCRSAVFPMMKRRRGCIVTMSSVAGVYGNPTQSNYAATKAGIIGFTKSLAKEVGRYGIRANVVAPGFVETDMTSGLAGSVKDAALQRIPLGRLGAAEEVAAAVSFLASDQAGYITGHVLQVDGGIVV